MKNNGFILLTTLIIISGFMQPGNIKKYLIIKVVKKQIPGFTNKINVAEINKKDVDKLNEPLKAIAAYYSSLAGSNCDGQNCELTSALGLGIQGSDKHLALLKKWFPNNQVAKSLITQDCFQSSNSSSHFTNYNSLIFEVNKDTVLIHFVIMKYDQGKTVLQKGNDKAIIKSNNTIILNSDLFNSK